MTSEKPGSKASGKPARPGGPKSGDASARPRKGAKELRRPATAEDVERAFLVFYGEQDAPAERVERRVGMPLGGLVKLCLASPKFRAAVVERLSAGRPVAHARHGGSVPIPAIRWLSSVLQRPQLGKDLAAAPLDWSAFFRRLLPDPRFVSAVRLAGAEPHWLEALERAPSAGQGAPEGDLVGAIEDYDGRTVRGWAADKADLARPLSVEVFGDGFLLGVAACERFRRSLQDRIGGPGVYGFELVLTDQLGRLFPSGVFTLSLRDAATKAAIGAPLRRDLRAQASPYDLLAFRDAIEAMQSELETLKKRLPRMVRSASAPVERFSDVAEDWHRVSDTERRALKLASDGFAYRPLFSILLPTYESDLDQLRGALTSVRDQIYERFELIVSDGGSAGADAIRALVEEVFAGDDRARFVSSGERLGVSANTNAALAEAGGDYVAFLDHDDALTPDALVAFAEELQQARHALIYSDEDRFTAEGGRTVYSRPFFKPDFDHDLLLSMNYVTHFVAIRKDVLDAAGRFDEAFDGAQDHDMILRVAERCRPDEIRHVPKILYHWRLTDGSLSRSRAQVAPIEERIVALVNAHLARTDAPATAARHADDLGSRRKFATRVAWRLPEPAPSVTVVIPTRDRHDLIAPCLRSVVASLPAYPGTVEILVVDNDSREPEAVAFLEEMSDAGAVTLTPRPGAFNWSHLNNEAAERATGEVLVFLNNDTLVASPDWLRELVSHAVRPEVGAVGARLLYEDGTIQHAGVLVGMSEVAGHDGVGQNVAEGGYFGRNHLTRRTSAVTGACLAVRAALFRETGGFDGERFRIAFNDVDFCLRLQEAGYANVYTPFATLYHFESKSRGFDRSGEQKALFLAESRSFYERWSRLMAREPFYNPNFSRHAPPFAAVMRA